MIADKRTIDEIRRDGIEALRDRLGPAGMIRFLQQFDAGSGDYTKERRDRLDGLTSEQIRESIKSRRKN